MDDDRFPIKTLFLRSGGQLPRGRHPNTRLEYVQEYVQDELRCLSEFVRMVALCKDISGMVALCKARNEWTRKICKALATHTKSLDWKRVTIIIITLHYIVYVRG
jgi:hypothetical protein